MRALMAIPMGGMAVEELQVLVMAQIVVYKVMAVIDQAQEEQEVSMHHLRILRFPQEPLR